MKFYWRPLTETQAWEYLATLPYTENGICWEIDILTRRLRFGLPRLHSYHAIRMHRKLYAQALRNGNPLNVERESGHFWSFDEKGCEARRAACRMMAELSRK